jgi:large subunit ribosomal protein L22
MEARAYLRHARISPRKVQIVLDLIRGKDIDKAIAILRLTPKAACEPLLKLLRSAQSNAVNNHDMDNELLFVSECFATPGPTLKRIRPKDHGKAFRILKRTSHVTMVLRERETD